MMMEFFSSYNLRIKIKYDFFLCEPCYRQAGLRRNSATFAVKKYSDKGFSQIFADKTKIFAEKPHYGTHCII